MPGKFTNVADKMMTSIEYFVSKRNNISEHLNTSKIKSKLLVTWPNASLIMIHASRETYVCIKPLK